MQCVYLGLVCPFHRRMLLALISIISANAKEISADMKYLFSDDSTRWRRRIALAVLAACWLTGLLLGIFYAARAGDTYSLLMRMAPSCRVSISGLAASALLPFLFAAFAVYISKPELLILVCFLKAFSFACCGFGVMDAFGSAGWLIRPLLQFSDGCTIPLLCWFSIRHISDIQPTWRADIGVCCMIAAVAVGFDYCLVSPFLVTLIEF